MAEDNNNTRQQQQQQLFFDWDTVVNLWLIKSCTEESKLKAGFVQHFSD